MKATLLFLALFSALPVAARIYLEANGLVVMEAESQDPGQSFSLEDTVQGYTGTGYFRGKINSFNTGGVGPVAYPFHIVTGGRYQFAFRSRIGEGTSSTDANDSFIRLVDEEGVPVTPVPNNHVVTSGSWYKVYMNIFGSWSHQASNKDNDPHSLSWQLEAGKTYAIQMAVRSRGHLVDRLILWNHARHSLANKTTGKGTTELLFNNLEESARAGDSIEPWAGFEVDPSGNADTGPFLGWINVTQSPWIWSWILDAFFYMSEPEAGASGAWGYFLATH